MRLLRKLLALAAVMTFLTAIAPPTGAQPLRDDWFIDQSKLPFEAIEGQDATQHWGTYNGSAFIGEVPANWNGDLYVYAHGFRGGGAELTVNPPSIREWLIENGYGWAAASYNANDYNIKAGIQGVRDSVKMFRRWGGEPDTVYLAGHSMGGHITAAAIEKYPDLFDGAMPMCGVLGDYELIDYFLDYNLAASQLTTGASTFPANPASWFTEEVPAIKEALAPGGSWPFGLSEQGEKFKHLVEDRSGGERPNFDEAWAYWHSVPTVSGPGNFLFETTGDGSVVGAQKVAVDNTDSVYQLDGDPALSDEEQAFNTSITRVLRHAETRLDTAEHPVPAVKGEPPVPVMSLHNLGDLFVTFEMERIYAAEVAANGLSDRLVQRAIRGSGHCDFTPAEEIRAFADLVNWVENGVVPAGDEMLDDAAVADPAYGCTFTDGEHAAAAPCS